MEAEKVAPPMAREAVECVRALYAIERQVEKATAEQRFQLRQEKTAPLLAELRQRLLFWKEQLLPRHPMAEAVQDALSEWTELNVFCRSKV